MAEGAATSLEPPTESANVGSGGASVGDSEPTAYAVDGMPPTSSGAPAPQVSPVLPPGILLLPEDVRQAIEAPPAGSPAAKRRARRAQIVDPRVSRAKFDREVEWFRHYEDAQRRRGLLLVEAAFPRVLLAVCVPQVRPYVLLFGVVIDYTNWDLEPPSVRLVNPFTLRPLVAKELSTCMKRQAHQVAPVAAPAVPSTAADAAPAGSGGAPAGSATAQGADPTTVAEAAAPPDPPAPGENVAPSPAALVPQQEVSLLQFSGPDDIPFLCLPGVLEYHEHPAHTGDSWWLHRTTGAGSLSHLLNAFHSYAVAPIIGFTADVGLRPVDGGVKIQVRGVRLMGRLPA